MASVLDGFSFSDGLTDNWLTATNFGGSDGSWSTPRTPDTVPSNALQSMTPVTASNDAGGWSDFWKGALQTAIGYSIQKDAVQSGVVRGAGPVPGQIGVAGQAQVGGQVAPDPLRGLMPLLLIGGVVLLAVNATK